MSDSRGRDKRQLAAGSVLAAAGHAWRTNFHSRFTPHARNARRVRLRIKSSSSSPSSSRSGSLPLSGPAGSHADAARDAARPRASAHPRLQLKIVEKGKRSPRG